MPQEALPSRNEPVIEREDVIRSDPAECARVIDDIERGLRGHGFNNEEIGSIKLALYEAIVNAMKHGNQYDVTKTVSIYYKINGERFDCCITDEGEGFDPNDVPDPTDAENLDRLSGRGLHIIKHYMTCVEYAKPGNSVILTRLRGEAHKNNVTPRDAGAGGQIQSLSLTARYEIGEIAH